MKIIKLNVLATIIFLSMNVDAAVNCAGVPSTVKMGEYGIQEAYIITTINGRDYRLGRYDEDGAKIRLSLVQSALLADKEVVFRFYDEISCVNASTNKTIPNSTQLIH